MNLKSNVSKFIGINVIIFSSFNFTGCIDSRAPSEPIEIDRPTSLGISPIEGTLAFPRDGKITMSFDEKMNISSFEGSFLLSDYDSNIVSGSFSEQDTAVFFTPLNKLEKSSIYYSSLRGGVRDANNNTIEFNGEATFSDTIEIDNAWFYTEGDYSDGGFYNVYLRDRRQGKIYTFEQLSQLGNEVSSLSAPEGFALSNDNNFMVISNTSKHEILIVNLNNYEIEATFPVADNPSSIVVKDNIAYIISINGRQITKIDLSSLSIVAQDNLGFYPGKLAISSDGTILYTFDQQTLDLVLLNTSNSQIIKRVSNSITGGVGGEITFDAISNQLFICDTNGKVINVIDKDGNQLNEFLSVPDGSKPIQFVTNDTDALLAADNILYKIDRESSGIISQKSFSGNIKSIVIIPSGEIAYLTLNTTVALVDIRTFIIIKEISIGVSGLEGLLSGSIKN
jgi:Bacterial Ig-like domain